MNKNLLIDGPLGKDLGPGRNPHGEICWANEARFTTATFSEGLTAYATGWQDPENLADMLAFIFPDVQTGRRFEFKRAENAQAFLTEADDVRAIGSPFKRVEYTGDTVLGKTLNKGLTMRVDHDQIDIKVAGWENRYVATLRQRMLRNELRRANTLLDATSVNTAKTWHQDGTADDPDGQMLDLLSLCADDSGIRPNRVLYSENTWTARRKTYAAINTPAAGVAAQATPDQLRGILLVDKVMVGKARYQSSATAKGKIITNLRVTAFFEEDPANLEDASNFKRFVSPCEDGQYQRVFIERMMKYTDITVESYSVLAAAHSLGVRDYTVSTS